MIRPALTGMVVLVLAVVAAAPMNMHHTLSGVMPDTTYEIYVDGVRVPELEPVSSSAGTMEFWTPYAGPGTHTLMFRVATGYVLEIGGCAVAPTD